MSVTMMAIVWGDDSLKHRSELLVMLALADFARDDGLCWPSIETVARKARVSVRGVQDVILRMEKAGKLVVETGQGQKGTNLYRVIKGGCSGCTPQPAAGKSGGKSGGPLHPIRHDPSGTVKTHQSTDICQNPERQLLDVPVTGIKPGFDTATTPKFHLDSLTILNYLNHKTSRTYRDTDSNLKLISARLKEEGVTTAGVRQMVDRMVQLWDSPKMRPYLRPATLFGKEKFGNYYDERELPVEDPTPRFAPRPAYRPHVDANGYVPAPTGNL